MKAAALLPAVGLLLPAVGLLAACGQDEGDGPDAGRPGAKPRPTAPRVTARSVMKHVRALQRVADRNGGNRAAGTRGDRASARYVAARLRRAGYRVRMEPVSFSFFQQRGRPRLSSRPTGRLRVRTLQYSGGGRARARLATVRDRGCERSDFASFPRGRVALIKRGECTLRSKVQRAQRAGAAGAVIFNEGGPGKAGLITGTLGSPGARIPAVFATHQDGLTLARTRPRVELAVRATSARRTTYNVLGDSRFGRGRRVMLGGHLDSVQEGPGANDNASGASTVLAIAEREASRPRPGGRPLRVGFWAAEEEGLIGSRRHVRKLPKSRRDALLVYMNLDMVGSRRGEPFTYGSDQPVVERLDEAARAVIVRRGGKPREESLGRNSDHAPFEDAGIPVYGLFSGAGAPHDSCYHRRCDTLRQIGRPILDDLSRAAAAAVGTALDPRKAEK